MPKEIKEYKTTKERCQERIDRSPVVCPGCGGVIVPLETVDNSGDPTFWSGCEHCQQFTHGFPSKVFEIAKIMVHEYHCQPFRHMPNPHNGTEAEKAYYYESQIRGTCPEVALVLRIHTQITDNQ